MFKVNEQSVWSCAAEAKRQWGARAETLVAQQKSWSEERGAEQETLFWSAVVERLPRLIVSRPIER